MEELVAALGRRDGAAVVAAIEATVVPALRGPTCVETPPRAARDFRTRTTLSAYAVHLNA
jgi:hypothetical protein